MSDAVVDTVSDAVIDTVSDVVIDTVSDAVVDTVSLDDVVSVADGVSLGVAVHDGVAVSVTDSLGVRVLVYVDDGVPLGVSDGVVVSLGELVVVVVTVAVSVAVADVVKLGDVVVLTDVVSEALTVGHHCGIQIPSVHKSIHQAHSHSDGVVRCTHTSTQRPAHGVHTAVRRGHLQRTECTAAYTCSAVALLAHGAKPSPLENTISYDDAVVCGMGEGGNTHSTESRNTAMPVVSVVAAVSTSGATAESAAVRVLLTIVPASRCSARL